MVIKCINELALSAVQRSRAMWSEGMQLFIFQSKHRTWSKVQGRSRSSPPPNTHIHNQSQTCTHAHKHPHLVERDRERVTVISWSYESKMMWVQMDGDPVWWDRLTKCLRWRKRGREEKEEEFSSGSCGDAAVGVLVSFPELWTALLGEASHSAGPGQLMSCLLTLSLPLFSHHQLQMWLWGNATC